MTNTGYLTRGTMSCVTPALGCRLSNLLDLEVSIEWLSKERRSLICCVLLLILLQQLLLRCALSPDDGCL